MIVSRRFDVQLAAYYTDGTGKPTSIELQFVNITQEDTPTNLGRPSVNLMNSDTCITRDVKYFAACLANEHAGACREIGKLLIQ